MVIIILLSYAKTNKKCSVCCNDRSVLQIGRIAKYNEIRERANISNEFGEGYFTALDVEEIVEGYED